ncbi:MAG: LPXTG cell wall anchor domain-containing protein [Streptococcaceae bacterium]|nr:LPXTG cell wall anchor domain-containing protein [Streptococcaceae bacterium]
MNKHKIWKLLLAVILVLPLTLGLLQIRTQAAGEITLTIHKVDQSGHLDEVGSGIQNSGGTAVAGGTLASLPTIEGVKFTLFNLTQEYYNLTQTINGATSTYYTPQEAYTFLANKYRLTLPVAYAGAGILGAGYVGTPAVSLATDVNGQTVFGAVDAKTSVNIQPSGTSSINSIYLVAETDVTNAKKAGVAVSIMTKSHTLLALPVYAMDEVTGDYIKDPSIDSTATPLTNIHLYPKNEVQDIHKTVSNVYYVDQTTGVLTSYGYNTASSPKTYPVTVGDVIKYTKTIVLSSEVETYGIDVFDLVPDGMLYLGTESIAVKQTSGTTWYALNKSPVTMLSQLQVGAPVSTLVNQANTANALSDITLGTYQGLAVAPFFTFSSLVATPVMSTDVRYHLDGSLFTPSDDGATLEIVLYMQFVPRTDESNLDNPVYNKVAVASYPLTDTPPEVPTPDGVVPGGCRFEKVDSLNGSGLGGAEFYVFYGDPSIKATPLNDLNGDGYPDVWKKIAFDQRSKSDLATITDLDGNQFLYDVINQKNGSVWLANNTNGVSGVKLGSVQQTTPPIIATDGAITTPDSGIFVVYGLGSSTTFTGNNQYFLVEKTAPTGYILDSSPQPFIVKTEAVDNMQYGTLDNANVDFALNPQGESSYIVTTARSNDGTAPLYTDSTVKPVFSTTPPTLRDDSYIAVKNIAAGQLPLTGAKGIWLMILFGLVGMLGVFFLWKRSKDKENTPNNVE